MHLKLKLKCVVSDVEQGFLPWLVEQLEVQLESQVSGRLVLDGLLREVVQNRTELYDKLEDRIRQELLAHGSAQQAREEKEATPVPEQASEQV